MVDESVKLESVLLYPVGNSVARLSPVLLPFPVHGNPGSPSQGQVEFPPTSSGSGYVLSGTEHHAMTYKTYMRLCKSIDSVSFVCVDESSRLPAQSDPPFSSVFVSLSSPSLSFFRTPHDYDHVDDITQKKSLIQFGFAFFLLRKTFLLSISPSALFVRMGDVDRSMVG